MKKNISFVVPAYNCEDTVNEAVESIFDTNFQTGDEVVIVNDASTDGTKSVIKNLKQKYPEIVVINNRVNKGCPATRNIGIKIAKSELIFNLDADDILAKGSVKILLDAMIKEKADLVAFSESRFFKTTRKKITHKWIYPSGIYTLADFFSGVKTPGGNYLYTKYSWKKIGGYWEYGKGLHEFWGFTLKQLASGSRMFCVPNAFYYHRYGNSSLYTRESLSQGNGINILTKMITPYLELLNDRDANYISSNVDWFDKLHTIPIQVKDVTIGRRSKEVRPISWHFNRIFNKLILELKKFFDLDYK